MKIKLRRTGHAASLKLFLPLACFLMVTFMTMLLHPASAEGRLTASTGVLVGTVMFHVSGVMGSLPPLGRGRIMDLQA